MIFSSITTIFFFLPIVMLGYFILYKLTKKNTLILNIYLCLVSLIFYWWGDNDNYNTKIILLLILVNYFFSYIIRTNTNVYAKRLSAIIAVAFDCIMLIRYKYPDIILTGGSIDNLIFPLGISFIIFHCISYIVDIYGICVKKCGGGVKLILYI